MKILFSIESLHPGGKERRLVELIKGLSRDSSYEMDIVLTKEGIHYNDIHDINIKIHYLIRKEGVKKDPKLFYEFYRIAKNIKPDIIHVWSNLTAIYALPAKIFLKIPLINNQITNSTIQNSTSLLSHKLTFPFSDRIIANTYAGLKAYAAPQKRSLVIYNGFNFDRISNLDKEEFIRNKFNITTKYVIGMVASFTEKKDYNTYIEAANNILEIRRDITFLCIGSGDSSKFKARIYKGNQKNILFLGKQNHVESIMNICDIGVLMTNTVHGEGISNAILEFCALAKPVIASEGGGTTEIIENGKSGFLIKDKSYLKLMEKLLLLVDNKEIRVELGKKAKQIVKDKFGINRMVNEFMVIYKEVIS